jgi:hypothetical protein
VEKGASITFEGSAKDADEEYGDTLTFKWSSDIDGDLGEGKTLEDVVLSSGEHTITLKVHDNDKKIIIEKTIKINVKGEPGPGDPGFSGTSGKEKEKGGFDYLPILLIIIIIVIILIIVFIVIKKKRGERREERGEAPPTAGEAIDERQEAIGPEPGTLAPTGPIVSTEVPQLPEPVTAPPDPVVEPRTPEPVEPVVEPPVEPITIEPTEPVVEEPTEPVVEPAPIIVTAETPKTRPVPEGSTARRLEDIMREEENI